MEKKIIEFNKAQRTKKLPVLRSGDIVKIHRKIKEGDKERIQIFEGIIIAIKGKQSSSETITVRKVSNGFGVELILPVISPNIEKIELVKRAKVRRAKLYYLRGLTAKKSRMKHEDLSGFVAEEKAEKPVEEIKTESAEDKTTEKEKKVEEKEEKKA